MAAYATRLAIATGANVHEVSTLVANTSQSLHDHVSIRHAWPGRLLVHVPARRTARGHRATDLRRVRRGARPRRPPAVRAVLAGLPVAGLARVPPVRAAVASWARLP